MGVGGQLNTCDGCGTGHGRIEDLGLPQPLALCGDCLLGAVGNWLADTPAPLTTSTVELAAGMGIDPRILHRRLETARGHVEDDTA